MEVTHQVKVVMPAIPVLPQPDLQFCESTQLPASPQSLAEMTVVGQNPQSPRSMSSRQPNPGSAVLDFSGSPS